MAEVAKLADLSVTYRFADSFPQAVGLLKNGKADLIPNSGILPERLKSYAFTSPVETFTVSLFVRNDTHDIAGINDLTGRNLAVVETNIGLFMFGERKDINIHVFQDVRSALFDLIAGRVDGLVYPTPVLVQLAQQIGIEDRIKTAGPPLKEIKRGIRVLKGNDALLAVLDKAVQSFVGTPEYQRIYAKWYGKPRPFWTVRRVAWTMGGAMAVLIIFMGWWRYRTGVRLIRALRESEERLKDIAEAATDRFWEVDENLRFTTVLDYSGRETFPPAEQIIGRTRWEIAGADPDKDEKWAKHRDDLLARRPFRDFQFAIPGENGTSCYLSVSGKPFFDGEGNFRGFRGSVTDITERKQAEEALKESEERLQDIAEASADRFWEMDKNLRFTSTFGYPGNIVYPPLAAFIGRTRWGVVGVDPDKDEAWGKHRDDLLARRPFRDFQFAIPGENGTSYYRSVSGKPFFDEEGNFRGYRGSVTDITERKQIEARLHGAIGSMQEGFILFDANDRPVVINDVFRRINPKAQEFLEQGKTFEDMLRANVERGWIVEAQGREEEFIRERMEQHCNPGPPIIRRYSDGKYYQVKESLTPEGGIAITYTDITELKQVEEALKESEERFRRAVLGAPIPVIMHAEDGEVLMVSNKWVELSGYSLSDIPTISDWTEKAYGIDKKHMKRQRKVINALYDLKEPGQHEACIITALGEKRTWEVHDAPLGQLSDGRSFVISMAVDVTERLEAEEGLHEFEARFRSVIENSPFPILLKDTKGRIQLANESFRNWYGLAKDGIVGKTSHGLYPKKYADAFTEQDREVLKSMKVIEREHPFPFADGTVRPILVTKFPVVDADNKTSGVGTINMDLSEVKQAEEAALDSQARLSGILKIVPEAVIAIGDDMNIRLFNQGAERIFGYSAKEVLWRPLEILMPESFRDAHRKHVEGFDRSEDTYRLMDERQEIAGLRKDGTEFPASASVSKLEVGNEKIFTVMLRDITQRKETEKALIGAKNDAEKANRAKSEFLAAMSHELRTPLNAILGFADILSNQYFGPISDKYKEYAEDIESSGGHLLTLVNDILDLSAIEAGKQSLVKEKLSTMEIVRECERIIKEKARSLGIDLITKVPKNLPPLYADKRASMQILLNLLANAVKFTPLGGKITMSAKATKRNTTLTITDTGEGIRTENLEKLTDPFTKATSDPYLAEQGWGLGLSITKSLVDLHDGTLDIKSKVGKGTTVTVTFPNAAA